MARSPTAAWVLSRAPFHFNTRSCGVDGIALIPLTDTLVQWADEFVCMTEYHAAVVTSRLNRLELHKPVYLLAVPDLFDYREPRLCRMISDRYIKHSGWKKSF